jgi:hypothetical protein
MRSLLRFKKPPMPECPSDKRSKWLTIIKGPSSGQAWTMDPLFKFSIFIKIDGILNFVELY